MTDQKSIARQLDRAAARAESANARPATGKQCWFLAGLLATLGLDADDAGHGALDSNSMLTSKAASDLIEYYIGRRDARLAA